MAIINIQADVGQGMVLQAVNATKGDTVNYIITGTGKSESYFTLETIRNASGSYDAASPKNTSGSFTVGSGLYGLIQSDYIASVIVSATGGTLTFVPATNVVGSTLFVRGTGYR